MAFFSTIFAPITWTISFFSSHWLAILITLLAAGGAAFLISYYFFGYVNTSNSSASTREHSTNNSPKKRKVTTIHESDEETEDGGGGENGTSTLQRPDTLEMRRMRKRDWAKKIYKSLVEVDSPGRLTPSDESSADSTETLSHQRRHLTRRHSAAGPFQMAKDLIRRGSRHYFRQQSEFLRDRLPLPPQEFFEPTDLPEIPQNLQPEIFYILHNLKMLELPAEWKLDPRDIEVRSFQPGEYVVRPGEADDSIYVAIEGSLSVYITHREGKEYLVKKIAAGSSFFSLLSMLDILMNVPSIFKTVSLKAGEKCRVAKFPISSFRSSYKKCPEAWTRPIQIVITRLLHVTMTTLHKYMGLSSELMKGTSREDQRILQSQMTMGGGHVGAATDGIRHTAEDRVRQPSGTNAPTPLSKPQMSMKKTKERKLSSSDEPGEQMAVAIRWLTETLDLGSDGPSALQDKVEIVTIEEGRTLIDQGSEEEQLIFVLAGSLGLIQEPVFDEELPDDEDHLVSRVLPREMIGGLQLLTNEPSFYQVKACCRTTVATISRKNFTSLLEAHPQIYLPVAHSVLRRLSPFLRGVDFALDWVLVDSGQSVYRAGDTADSMFVVLSGRLRSVEKKTVVEEFGRGDVMGMMEVLQKKTRATTVLAVRFSQLARVPEGLLNFIKIQFPQVGFRLVQLLGQYYSSLNRRAPFVPGSLRNFDTSTGGDPMSHIKNLHTIAVVPASPEIPLVAFTCELYHALSANLRVLRLSSQKVASYLDNSVLEKYLQSEEEAQADFRLMHWLNVQEDTYPLVIYECDYAATNWTRRCLRQADAILVVALGNKKPAKQTLMRELLNVNQDGVRTNKELILLWPEGTKSPTGTYEWLKNSYFSGHHHIRAKKRMFQWQRKNMRKSSQDSVFEKEIIEFYEKNVFWTPDHKSDFARLARILTGNAIGLVLGGGGARGAAHVGVIRAMREQGVPVDIVGGTSIGSMIGGLFAETPDERLEERARSWFDGMTSLWRKILDLTYAHSAMFTGAQFNKSLQDLFGEVEIEDLWIPYFCISTDISTSEMRVHRAGPLWAYCRASMSLAGYLPPLCDPLDGHLLLDGGYVNNLPADIMRSMGAKCVIAVDVGSIEETNLFNYGTSLSGLWVLFNRFNPWAQPQRILNMEEIQSRLAYVSCVRQLETVKKAPYCHYLRPAIEPFKTLDFGKYQNILLVGYEYGKDKVAELMLSVELQSVLFGEGKDGKLQRQTSRRREKRNDLSRTVSFTDLAAAMSKVPIVRPVLRHSYSAFQPGEDFDGIFSDDADSETDNEMYPSDLNDVSEAEDDHPVRGLTPRPI